MTKNKVKTEETQKKWKKYMPGKLTGIISGMFLSGYLLTIGGITAKDVIYSDKNELNKKKLEERIVREINNSKIPSNHVKDIYFITSDIFKTQVQPEGKNYVCLYDPYPSNMYKIGFTVYDNLSKEKKEKFRKMFSEYCNENVNQVKKGLENAYFVAEKGLADSETHHFAVTYALYYSEGAEDILKSLEKQMNKKKFNEDWKPFFDSISEGYKKMERTDLSFIGSNPSDAHMLFLLYSTNFPRTLMNSKWD